MATLIATAAMLSAISLRADATVRLHQAAAAPCPTSQLVIWLGPSGGAAGTTYYDLHFTNLGATACTMFGFPGVSAVNLAGRQIGAAATRNGAVNTAKAATVTVASAATATSLLGIVDAGNYPATSCHPTTAAGVRVYPPNERGSRVVPFPFPACSAQKDRILTIKAIERSFNPS